MTKKPVYAISLVALLSLSILVISSAAVKAWEYNDGTSRDTLERKHKETDIR